MKIKFIKEQDTKNKFDTTRIEMITEASNLDGILEDFKDFLKACGYCFDGNIEVVEDEV